MMQLRIWFGLMLGGALGAGARYLVSGWIQSYAGQKSSLFPWGTLSVNVIGCLVMGLLFPWFMERNISEEYRIAILTGTLGAFTTWSTFGLETVQLLQDRQWTWAGVNVLGTNVACFVAVILGYRIAQALLQSS